MIHFFCSRKYREACFATQGTQQAVVSLGVLWLLRKKHYALNTQLRKEVAKLSCGVRLNKLEKGLCHTICYIFFKS